MASKKINMLAFIKTRRGNYDFLSSFAWYVPGVSGMFIILGWILVGTIIGSVVSLLLPYIGGKELWQDYIFLISYPITFIPAIIAAKYISNKNMLFENGYALDSNNFGEPGGWKLALLLTIATLGGTFIIDLITSFLPPMPKYLEDALKSLVQGKLWVNFICVSIFAPLFEEIICRGFVLRGLLNFKRKDGSSIRPLMAILISALFFAVIHLNPWQAIPAFLIGALMGFVYYKTGSLKLTILIHFVNNTASLVIANIDKFKDADSWLDILPVTTFAALCVVSAIYIAYICFFVINKIRPSRPEGSCDLIETEGMIQQD